MWWVGLLTRGEIIRGGEGRFIEVRKIGCDAALPSYYREDIGGAEVELGMDQEMD